MSDNDYHIEHLNPQSSNSVDELDYCNLLCSCLRSTESGTPLHCGHLKGNKIIKVHPLQPDCQSKFKFTGSGEIKPKDKDACETIETLGLNIPKLIDMRNKALTPFLESNMSNDEFQKFVVKYMKRQEDGKFNPFCSAVACVFRLLEEEGS